MYTSSYCICFSTTWPINTINFLQLAWWCEVTSYVSNLQLMQQDSFNCSLYTSLEVVPDGTEETAGLFLDCCTSCSQISQWLWYRSAGRQQSFWKLEICMCGALGKDILKYLNHTVDLEFKRTDISQLCLWANFLMYNLLQLRTAQCGLILVRKQNMPWKSKSEVDNITRLLHTQ